MNMEDEYDYRYFKIGEFTTVGDLKRLLKIFPKDMEIGFVNQRTQDLYVAVERKEDGTVEVTHLGFQ